jgi:translation initiation factor 2 subunit 2
MDYETRLDRAMEAVPEIAEADDRLQVPDPAGETDGAFTRLTNLPEIADALSRDAEHIHRTIQAQLGTNGQYENGQARYNGSFRVADFEAAIDAYTEEYVLCSECGLPDTRLTRENGTQMLRCEACGAFRPVAKNSSNTSQADRPTLEEGGTYEVKITGVGRKGDGVAEKGKYTIFVSGATEGQVVRVRIDDISGTLAFATPV